MVLRETLGHTNPLHGAVPDADKVFGGISRQLAFRTKTVFSLLNICLRLLPGYCCYSIIQPPSPLFFRRKLKKGDVIQKCTIALMKWGKKKYRFLTKQVGFCP